MIAADVAQAVRRSEESGSRPGRVVVSFPLAPFNPFPAELVAQIGPGVAHVGVAPSGLTAATATARAIGAPAVFHLHWTSWVLGAETDRASAEARLDAGLALLDDLADFPLVWTVHNTLPHECLHVDLEVRLRERIIDQAALIHVMNPLTAQVVSEWYRLPTDKVVRVPHPPHRPAITIDLAEARERLGLDPERRYVAFLGQIRPYKGLDLLLDALDRAPEVWALVAGSAALDAASAAHAERAALHPRVVPYLRHVDDELLDLLAIAADAIVLPHRRMLNSGIVEVARTAGTPLIAPDLRHVRALIDPCTVFAAGDAAALAAALVGDLSDPLPRARDSSSPVAAFEPIWRR